VNVGIDRSAVPEGSFSSFVTIASDGGSATVAVSGVQERVPRLVSAGSDVSRLAISRCPGTHQATVSATVEDESGVASVTVVAGGSRIALGSVGGGSYRGVLGPYDTPGPISFHIEASDTRGNVARSTTGTLEVVDC
jgi:hypothetical protein